MLRSIFFYYQFVNLREWESDEDANRKYGWRKELEMNKKYLAINESNMKNDFKKSNNDEVSQLIESHLSKVRAEKKLKEINAPFDQSVEDLAFEVKKLAVKSSSSSRKSQIMEKYENHGVMTVKPDIVAKVEKMTTDYQNQKVKKGSWRKDMARY